jgi:dihydrolipoamide dehydrogenase
MSDTPDVSPAFDVIVIGSGPGGYVCAIRAAQLGLKTACVEKRATLGGTCLNIGCIPSKALLQSSEEFEKARQALKDHGVMVEGVTLDLARMQARKGQVVAANVKGVEFLFRKNKVTWLKGTGRITAPGTVDVDGTSYTTKNIVIATGSESAPLPWTRSPDTLSSSVAASSASNSAASGSGSVPR